MLNEPTGRRSRTNEWRQIASRQNSSFAAARLDGDERGSEYSNRRGRDSGEYPPRQRDILRIKEERTEKELGTETT